MSIYSFCVDCSEKIYKYDGKGKLISHSCPAKYNPFDEDMELNENNELVKVSKCPRHDKFMKLEKQKSESAALKKFGKWD